MEKGPKKKAKKRPARPRPTAIEDGNLAVRIGRRNVILFVIAIATILLGFVTLALGSTSLPAILLVGGYLILVPWAILAPPGDEAKPASPSRSPE